MVVPVGEFIVVFSAGILVRKENATRVEMIGPSESGRGLWR